MNKVFESANLGNITLNNRIIRAATHEGIADEKNRPTEELIKKYEMMAKGGVGAIITGYTGIMQNGKAPFESMMMIDSDSQIESFKVVADRIHELNTPIILQIAHCGRQTKSKVTGERTVAPSAIRDKIFNDETPHELTESEIIDIIDNFVSAIVRAKKAGFDGVQLHLAHGYLLSSFLSPHMNKRKDKWGGNTENRFRIVKEILLKARKEVGDYTIIAKINAYEKSKDGMKTEEAIEIAKMLEMYGCDGIEISSGITEDGFWTMRGELPFDMMTATNEKLKKIPGFVKPAVKFVAEKKFGSPKPYDLFNLDSAFKIKKAVNIPVIVVGGIKTIDQITDIIENNKTDFVSMSRPFIIEPNIVNKFKEGKQTASRCINCNYCLIGIEERPLKCYYGRVPKK